MTYSINKSNLNTIFIKILTIVIINFKLLLHMENKCAICQDEIFASCHCANCEGNGPLLWSSPTLRTLNLRTCHLRTLIMLTLLFAHIAVAHIEFAHFLNCALAYCANLKLRILNLRTCSNNKVSNN